MRSSACVVPAAFFGAAILFMGEPHDSVLDIAHRNVKAAEKTLKAQEKTYAAAKERYSEGLVSTHDMVSYQEHFDRARLNFLLAIVTYKKAVIDLGKQKGTILADNNVKIEEMREE